MHTFIEESSLASWQESKQYTLSPNEVKDIIANKDVIKKLLTLRRFAIQEEIGSGLLRWREEVFHEVVKVLNEMSTDFIQNLEIQYAKYISVQAEESLQKE